MGCQQIRLGSGSQWRCSVFRACRAASPQRWLALVSPRFVALSERWQPVGVPSQIDGGLHPFTRVPVSEVSPARAQHLVLRSNLQSTRLVHLLGPWLPTAVEAPRQDVAERLGQWLNVNETITLHQTRSAAPAAARRAGESLPLVHPPADLHDEFQQALQRVRGVLSQSILARDPSHRTDPNDLDVEWALFQQRLHDQQRRMALSVDALRSHVRQRMASSTPALAQLAALDAAMAPLFNEREQRLLATTLPALLKAHFTSLRQAAGLSNTPEDLRWLQTFAAEFEQILLAELELRLLPVTGLIEAFEA